MKALRRAYRAGRAARLSRRAQAAPLYSRNATWQSAFEKGWQSVTAWDFYHAARQDSRHGLMRAKALFGRAS